MLEKYVEGYLAGKILKQLTRIADALEISVGLMDIADSKKEPNFELMDQVDIEKEENEKKQVVISEVLEKNDGKFLWAEDNLKDSTELEEIE